MFTGEAIAVGRTTEAPPTGRTKLHRAHSGRLPTVHKKMAPPGQSSPLARRDCSRRVAHWLEPSSRTGAEACPPRSSTNVIRVACVGVKVPHHSPPHECPYRPPEGPPSGIARGGGNSNYAP